MTELTDQTTRRAVLGGVAAVGAGAVLAACGSDEPTSSTGGGDATSDSGSGGDAPAGGEIGTTADVPVGGGTVFQKQKIVVTQRSEEHTSELQSRLHLVCRLLLEKKNK